MWAAIGPQGSREHNKLTLGAYQARYDDPFRPKGDTLHVGWGFAPLGRTTGFLPYFDLLVY